MSDSPGASPGRRQTQPHAGLPSTPQDRYTDLIATALPELHAWSGRPQPDDLAPLPGCPAVVLFVDGNGRPVQLLSTQQLKRLVISRLCRPVEQRRGRADLAEVVRGVRWRPVHCPFEGRLWYYRLARVLHAGEYRKLVAFKPAWFLHVDWRAAAPEIRVTDSVWCEGGAYLGPWPTRSACQQSLDGLRDLFDLCRYPQQVRKAPRGTRCAYAEMGHCDAPCDGSVELAPYVQRCHAAWRFTTGGADEWVAEARQRMSRAADEQAYELAGQLKQQLRFAESWKARWATNVHPTGQLNYLLALPVTRRRAWKLFLFRLGHLVDGPVVADRRVGPDSVAWLREELARATGTDPAVVRMEQTWLFCHLLFNRESAGVMRVHLPSLEVPVDLEQTVTEAVSSLRS